MKLENLTEIKKSKFLGSMISDAFVWSLFIVFLVNLAANSWSLHYDVSGSYGALLFLPAFLITYIWRFSMMMPVFKGAIKSKDGWLALYSAFAGLIGGYVILWAFGFFLSKKGLTITKEVLTETKILKGNVKTNASTETKKSETKTEPKKVSDAKGLKILLTCASAASTGILANLVKKELKKTGNPDGLTIEAIPYPVAESTFNDYDVLLVAPQAGFRTPWFKAHATTAKVAKIPEDTYGKMKGNLIIDLAMETYNQK